VLCDRYQRNHYSEGILIRKAKGKRPLGRPMRRCEDNMITDLKEIGINPSTVYVGNINYHLLHYSWNTLIIKFTSYRYANMLIDEM
jgi:hypothetical protein